MKTLKSEEVNLQNYRSMDQARASIADFIDAANAIVLHENFPEAEIIVYGHTHVPLLELVDNTVTVMNPGSAGNPTDGRPPSVGIMELEPGIPPRARLVPLE